jgi:hypothetical protein
LVSDGGKRGGREGGREYLEREEVSATYSESGMWISRDVSGIEFGRRGE